MEDNDSMKEIVDELSSKLQQKVDDLCEKITEDNAKLEKQVEDLGEKITEDSAKLAKQVEELGEKMAEENATLQRNIDKLSENIGRMSEVRTVIIMIIIIATIFTGMMMADTKYPQRMMPSPYKRSILMIAGGQKDFGYASNSVEVFNWLQKTWTLQNAMSTRHSGASAVIYKGQIIISGGSDGNKSTDTIETSSCDEPLQWKISAAKLPDLCRGHAAVMYKDSLILSGGGTDISKISNKIYAVSMVPPHSSKILTTMPEPRYDHTMELFEDKLFIFGGYYGGKAKDKVMMYDLITKKWKMMPPLPSAVDEMASVLWQNSVVILGGRNNSDGFDTALTYNLTSGESKYLPSMKHKRRGCTAVVTGDVLVVMGGYNTESKYLKSVEAFSFEHQVWEELPDMSEARTYASAVVFTTPPN